MDERVKELRIKQRLERAALMVEIITGQATAVIKDLGTMTPEEAGNRLLMRAAVDNCRVAAMMGRHGLEMSAMIGGRCGEVVVRRERKVVTWPPICEGAYRPDDVCEDGGGDCDG